MSDPYLQADTPLSSAPPITPQSVEDTHLDHEERASQVALKALQQQEQAALSDSFKERGHSAQAEPQHDGVLSSPLSPAGSATASPLLSHESALSSAAALTQSRLAQALDASPMQESLETSKVEEEEEFRASSSSYTQPLIDARSPVDGNHFDLGLLDALLESYPATVHEAIRQMAKMVNRVAFESFLTELKACADSFNSYLSQKLSEQPYHVVGMNDKSSLWVASLIHPLLDQKPADVCPQDTDGEAFRAYLQQLSAQGKPLPRHLVFFDDAAYSGSQLANSIQDCYRALITHDPKLKSRLISCTVVVPFSTESAAKFLTQTMRSCGLRGMLLASKEIKTADQALSRQQCGELSRLLWPQEIAASKANRAATGEAAQDFIVPSRAGPFSRGLLVFEHKVPDKLSFPEPLARLVPDPQMPPYKARA